MAESPETPQDQTKDLTDNDEKADEEESVKDDTKTEDAPLIIFSSSEEKIVDDATVIMEKAPTSECLEEI